MDVNTLEALAALRSIELPRGRKTELARQILSAEPVERARIIYRARAQAVAAEDAARDKWVREFGKRQERPSAAPETAQEPLTRPLRSVSGDDAPYPRARPVTVRFVEPIAPLREPTRRDGIAAPPLTPTESQPVRRHGTTTEYQRGCRCDECRQAHSDYYKRWRAKRKNEP